MHTVVINLERSMDRRRHMENEFAAAGMPFEFQTAVDGHAEPHPLFKHYDEARCIGFYGKPLTKGAIGCFASHYMAWERSVATQAPILILEDDIRLRPNFRQAAEVLESLMAQYPMIRLFGINNHPSRLVRRIGDMELFRFLRGPAGTQSYAVSPKGAAILIAGARWWREPVDRYLDRFWTHGIQSLGLRPFPIEWTEAWGSETRIWESKSTHFTFVRKIARAGEHVARHVYNLRHRP